MSDLIPLLVAETGLSEVNIRSVTRNASIRYKTYSIPKRNGGIRLISQPAREVKALQKVIVSFVIKKLPVHSSAMAYRPGISIRDNAIAHVSSGSILKYDFESFFPSIPARDWEFYCLKNKVFAHQEDVALSTKILFYQRTPSSTACLAIGAPSSPALSNALMFDFDDAVCRIVSRDQVTYTRYADDLTFSAKRTGFLTVVDKALRRVIRATKFPSLKINESKTVSATRRYKRFVTGLVLTNDGNVSIGHERKRAIRAALHHAEQEKLDDDGKRKLRGLLAFIQNVEPNFFNRLEDKYGSALIASLNLKTCIK